MKKYWLSYSYTRGKNPQDEGEIQAVLLIFSKEKTKGTACVIKCQKTSFLFIFPTSNYIYIYDNYKSTK